VSAPPAGPLPADLAAALGDAAAQFTPLGAPLLYFPTIGSTNDVAAALVADGHREGAVIIADAQTAGRGRRGHEWFSPAVGGLYVSVVLAAPGGLHDRATMLTTIAAGVALCEGIAAATGLAPDIKWPNDLYAGGRKLAGILAEAVTTPTAAAAGRGAESIVLGFGINVGPMRFPPELVARATSLDAELGHTVDRAAVCASALGALAARYRDLLAGRFDAILDAWRRHAPGSQGTRVRWDSPAGPQSGITAGVDDSGALLVRTARGIERIVAGELVWG
jgi:BirA family biotin operon repressor/biotin-[acetyl-CoA-carboxylase] ligase